MRFIIPLILIAAFLAAPAYGQLTDSRPVTEQIVGKTKEERIAIKKQAFTSKVTVPLTYTQGEYTIEIQDIQPIEGGIQVFVRAWDQRQQLGFGADGTVEIERIRIINPPVLVPDGTKRIENIRGELVEFDNFKEDVVEALKIDVANTVARIAKTDAPIKVGKRGNTVSTFYTYGAITGEDGVMGTFEGGWDTKHDLATSDYIDANDLTARGYNNGNYSIERGYTGFDTKEIPDTDEITAATVSLWGVTKYTSDNDGDDWINVVQATPASSSNFAAADFDQMGAINNPTEGSTRLDVSSDIVTGAYNDWALNATGLTWIDPTGYTEFGWREGHDAIDSPYANTGAYTGMRFQRSENAGSTQDPKLVVTHSAPAAPDTNNAPGKSFIHSGASVYIRGDGMMKIY